MTTFQKRNEAPIKIADLSKFLLRDFLCLPEFPDYFSKCLFDCQVRPRLMELNRSVRDILLTIDNNALIY